MGSTGLRRRSGTAVADAVLRRSLAAATAHLAARRREAIGSLGNWEELRRSARSMRDRHLMQLPHLLERLAQRVEANGGRVFFAVDGAEACSYVLQVARRRGAHRVAKSKSMVSNEIGLNATLESAGIEVVETDLGEWIVQLADQPPSHIIAPALHLNRRQIAGIMGRPSGENLSDDPHELTMFARRELREVFLSADIGISGVNLAVAGTGTVCLITNEGNGRLVTSLPPVHIALMGMERVVESWADFDLALSLLPRSATGQALTAYTTMMTGPRRAGEADGPEELHLVILDNGRSAVLGSPYREVLRCLRCGACLNACPVFRQIGGHAYASTYSGPIGAVISPLLIGGKTHELSLACSLCGICYQVCPVMIPLQDLLLSRRRDNSTAASRAEKWLWRVWAGWWSRPVLYRVSTRLAHVVGRFVPSRLVPRWGAGRDVPRPHSGETVPLGEGR